MGSVRERIRQHEQKIAEVAAPVKKEYFGHADVFERSKINLRADVKGKTSDNDAEWHFEDGSKDSPPTPIKISLSARTTEIHTFDVVPDDKANYEFAYKLKCKLDGMDKELKGNCDFTVWPQTLHITAKYKEGDKHPTLKDGDLVERFEFKIIQKGGQVVSRPWFTDKNGICEPQLTDPGIAKIVGVSPWEIIEPKEQKDDDPRKLELQVSLKPWKSKIRSHAGETGRSEDKPHKQYVNLKSDVAGGGSLIEFKVGPEDLTLAKKDQRINVRVTFPADISKRNDPAPALWTGKNKATAVKPKKADGKPGVDELVCELIGDQAIKIPADGQPAVFYVQMGYAGGVKAKIEIGVTDTLDDDVFYVESWRKLLQEILVAEKDLRQKTPLLADDGAALGAALLAELKRIYDGTYIEFEFPNNACVTLAQGDFLLYLKGHGEGADFTLEDIDKPQHLFIDKAKFATWDDDGTKKTLNNGDKVFLLSDYQSRLLRHVKLEDNGISKTKNTMTWVFCDFISSRSKRDNIGGGPTFKADMSKVYNAVVHSFIGSAEDDVDIGFHVFDYDPIEANGNFGIKSVIWRIQKYRKKGEVDWQDVANGTPGEAYKDWSADHEFIDINDRNKWAEIVNAVTLKVKLPKDNPNDPGNLLTIKKNEPKSDGSGTEEVEYETQIQVVLFCYGVDFNVLGGAIGGAGSLRTGVANALGMAQTMAHEIAHNLGQGYSATGGDTGGRQNAEPGLPLAGKVPAERYYLGHGHQGCHCAKQLMELLAGANNTEKTAVCNGSFATPSDDHKKKYFDKLKHKDHCIMWGDGPEAPSDSMDFCDLCKEYISATDMSDVCKSW